MGTSGGDGGGWPPDGGGTPDDPDLPPEWQALVVPDDPAALALEAAAVRRELRRQARRERWQRRLGAGRRPGELRIPLVVLGIAILVTLASVFAATWPGKPRLPVVPRNTATIDTAEPAGLDLPALELVDADGKPVPLRGELPAVIMLIDGCPCGDLVTRTAEARPDLTVVTVTAGKAAPGFSPPATTASPPTGPGVPIRHLVDPTGELRSSLPLGAPDGTAAVLLVSDAGRIFRLVPHTTSVEDFRADLPRI